MSGCAICVYDLYNDALKDYRMAVNELQLALTFRNIPRAEWPSELSDEFKSPSQSDTEVSLSAFEALERSLRETR